MTLQNDWLNSDNHEELQNPNSISLAEQVFSSKAGFYLVEQVFTLASTFFFSGACFLLRSIFFSSGAGFSLAEQVFLKRSRFFSSGPGFFFFFQVPEIPAGCKDRILHEAAQDQTQHKVRAENLIKGIIG